jgi:hypothetical protein
LISHFPTTSSLFGRLFRSMCTLFACFVVYAVILLREGSREGSYLFFIVTADLRKRSPHFHSTKIPDNE